MILRRYLAREMLTASIAVLGTLMLVFVAARFARLLAAAAAGEIAPAFILELLALKGVDALAPLLPAAAFTAIVLTLRRLDRDHEIVAMTVGGWSRGQLVGTVIAVGAGFSLLAGMLSFVVAPLASDRYESLKAHAVHTEDVSRLMAKRFTRMGREGPVLYIERVVGHGRSMEQVFVHASEGGVDEVILAARARLISGPDGRFVALDDGYRYLGTPGEADWSIGHFGRYTARLIEMRPETVAETVDSMSTPSLWAMRGDDRAVAAELQWRVSQPVLTLVLAALAFPTALSGAGRGRFTLLFVGTVSYFAYLGLIVSATQGMESGELPPAIGVWPIHAGFGAAAVLLCRRDLRDLRRRRGSLRPPGPGGSHPTAAFRYLP